MAINKVTLEQILSNDPTFTHLDLSHQRLTSEDIGELVKVLEKNTHIKTLDVSGNAIGDVGAELLSASHLHFTSLHASECNIGSAGVLVLAKNTRLNELLLASNEVNDQDVIILANNVTLQSLSLAGNNLGDEAAITLTRNETLASLILSHNQIGINGSQALAKHKSLSRLDLSYNQVKTEGAIALARNPRLKSLVLAGNNIATPGIVALGSENTTLTELDVSYNEVNNQGAIGLSKHPTLKKLNLAYNQVGFEGAYGLASMPLDSLIIGHNLIKDTGTIRLAESKSLTYLDLTGNRVSFEGAYALAMNNKLKNLILSSNVLGDAGGVVLAGNKTLEFLSLSYNSIKDAGAISLAGNTTLKTLNLNYNMVGDKGRKALSENKTLHALIFSPEQPPEFTDENLDTIFLLSESFLCISDTKGILQFFNPSYSRVLGYNDDDLLAKSLFDFLHPLDKAALEKRLSEEKETPIQCYENRLRCKDGSYIIVRWTSNIKHQRMYAVGTDVTKQRRLEKEFILAKEASILARLHDVEAHNQQQTRFISQLSHEVRNPLSSIYGLIDILKEHVKEVEMFIFELRDTTTPILQQKLNHTFKLIGESFEQMIACAEYQKAILNRNLDMVRISEKKLTLENRPFELKNALQQMINIFQIKALKKNVAIKLIAPEQKEIWVKGDSLRLKQIITNLIGNAVKFTAQGQITLVLAPPTITENRVHVKIDVIDTGIGLDNNEVNSLFKRFSQANLSTGAQHGGSGLGLFISRELANAMDGNITVTSEKGKGSIFTVTLVYAALSPQEIKTFQDEELLQQSPRNSVTPTFFFKRKILIVDDIDINRKILANILTKAGHEIMIASNGEEALSAYNKFIFDVILMDIVMPVMDGLTATREIRRKEREENLPRTPIFAITANALEVNQQEGLAAGIDQYLTKPFNKDEICEKIDALIFTADHSSSHTEQTPPNIKHANKSANSSRSSSTLSANSLWHLPTSQSSSLLSASSSNTSLQFEEKELPGP